jgi:hypothetical protein
MDSLPRHKSLAVNLLTECFQDTTNSYKFYWFLAILDHLKDAGQSNIPYEDLYLRMISSVWYPLDYFKLSFGKQDSFKKLAISLSCHLKIDNGPLAPDLYKQLINSLTNDQVASITKEVSSTLHRWVAFRFLRPFFHEELAKVKNDHLINGAIIKLANEKKKNVPYHFGVSSIIIDESWKEYFQSHQAILRGFINWHLIKFLQKNNPNVIGLSEKLFRPKARNLIAAKKYWTTFLAANNLSCIYSGRQILPNEYSLDHFVPWSYITHDQLWNLVPVSNIANSSKGDQLPDLPTYFDQFCRLQFSAFSFYRDNGAINLLEDYYSVLPGDSLLSDKYDTFSQKMKSEISAHLRSAKNLGFRDNFIYRTIDT